MDKEENRWRKGGNQEKGLSGSPFPLLTFLTSVSLNCHHSFLWEIAYYDPQSTYIPDPYCDT